MTKQQFLAAVRQRLTGLDQSDVDRFLDYYAEMIDDRMEDGLSEQESVASMGTPEYVASQILMDTPVPVQRKKGGLVWWHWMLIILGCPLWIPLILALISIAFSVLITLFSIIIGLAATVLALLIAGFTCTAAGIGGLIGSGLTAPMLALTASGMIITGLSILVGLGFGWGMKALIRVIRWAVTKLIVNRKEAQHE